MVTSIIVTLSLWGLVGLFKLFEKWQERKQDKTVQRFTESRPSYGIMTIFKPPSQEVREQIERLIIDFGYEITSTTAKNTSFDKWNDHVYFDSKKSKKGIIELDQVVVFNDPEFVVIVYDDQISKLSGILDCRIIVSIWERISSSIIFAEYEHGKLISSTSIVEGKQDGNNQNPHKGLLKHPDEAKLKATLLEKGLNTHELFYKNGLTITEYSLLDREESNAANTNL